ncbi:arsenate reductase family protein [Enterococcus dongliensis]|uniref:Arsenate reductase family protein n=1 Tax=Enterococcus dongliensis TaxID=2559925 RepID=A0AAP5NJ33_9ENTE|nr:arsenate reductase family protein [Enterococcus dongliensis]MDT2596798.1 arsenate reductase family protein [Enterococcus dongliensis]MDT2603185.1 arsenate reductase family protein [Enterococcus dongliensis]MDT2633548.1 arsenate reductase family protein [Enterococcus dongliensis]MDT2636078.1 arsenate reductase family protein [Enterococcus dongliensis]MDT2639016.1 arsenate reductase family protein [Enterococcus dongliensis]
MVKFYWYPKCSTCRKAKAWLDQADVDYETIDLVQATPSAAAFEKWLTASELPIRKFFNTSGMRYRELGLKDKVADLSVKEASELLASDGMLVKRPLLIKEDQFLLNGFKETIYEGVFNK